jgi:glutamine synthetase
MGAGPEVANTEYGSGQFEVTNSPFWGVEIADMAFFYRTSIKELLAKKGYSATFMSKPLANMSGSGAHMNHSLYDLEGNNLFYDSTREHGLSDLCLNFIGGQLRHAKALTALCNPTINSYKRLQPYSFAPNKTSWGYEHRSAMIRVPGARGEHTRLENRLPGSDTNPYITLAALLAAGLDGIKNKIQPLPPLQNMDAYSSDLERLPTSLPEALVELENDECFANILGKEFIDHYSTLRKSEWNRFLKAVTDWELKEYLPLF